MMQGFYLLTMRRMRRQKRIACAALVFALASAAFAGKTFFTAAPAMTATAGYVATTEDNRLVIYPAGGADEPLLRTAIDTRTLPQSEQDALRLGVPLSDAEALAKLLEDYGS